MIENTGTVSLSQPLGIVKVPATGILELPKSPPQGPFPAAGIMTSSLSPIMSNKEYMELLRDYYSIPPEQLMSLRQGMFKSNIIVHNVNMFGNLLIFNQNVVLDVFLINGTNDVL